MDEETASVSSSVSLALLPIRLVVVAVSRGREFQKLVVEVAVAFSRLWSFEHRHCLVRDAVALGAIVVVPVATVVAVVPKAIVLTLGTTFEFRALPHVFNAAVLAFPFLEGRHRAHRHCHWRHWLHCHCSSCLFLMSRLQRLVSYPVPILWIVFYNTGGMQYEVSSTRQCHILVALYETIRHQSQCHDVIANAHRQCWWHCCC